MSVRTARDAHHLREIVQSGASFVCIGGGILGLETAGALARRGAEVTLLEGFDWLMPRQLNRRAAELLTVHASNFMFRAVSSTVYLFLCKFTESIDMVQVAFLQEPVIEHLAKWRGKRHGDSEWCSTLDEFIEEDYEGNIGFSHCFEKPIFFKELGIIRVPDKRQMGVQDK